MPITATIPINSSGECLSYLYVQYKRDFELEYRVLEPYPKTPTFLIQDLDADATYNVMVTKFCCNGQQSNLLQFDITTPTP